MKGNRSKYLAPAIQAYLEAPYGTTYEALAAKVGTGQPWFSVLMNTPLGLLVREIRDLAHVREIEIQKKEAMVKTMKEELVQLKAWYSAASGRDKEGLLEEITHLKSLLSQVLVQNQALGEENRELKKRIGPKTVINPNGLEELV